MMTQRRDLPGNGFFEHPIVTGGSRRTSVNTPKTPKTSLSSHRLCRAPGRGLARITERGYAHPMDLSPCNIVLFARAPVPGRTKTRLARDLGDVAAARVAGAMLDDICATLRSSGLSNKTCCYEGDRREIVAHVDADFELRKQPQATLSARLISALSLKRKLLLLLADVPQVAVSMINEAVTHLQFPKTAYIGPVEDGGVWCVGLNEVDPSFLEKIDMASNTFAVDVIRALPNGVYTKLGQRLRDIDTIGDARALAEAYPSLQAATLIANAIT